VTRSAVRGADQKITLLLSAVSRISTEFELVKAWSSCAKESCWAVVTPALGNIKNWVLAAEAEEDVEVLKLVEESLIDLVGSIVEEGSDWDVGFSVGESVGLGSASVFEMGVALPSSPIWIPSRCGGGGKSMPGGGKGGNGSLIMALNPPLPQNSKQGQTGSIVGCGSPGRLVVICDAVSRPGISVEIVLKEYWAVGVSTKPVGLTITGCPPIVTTWDGTTPPSNVEVGSAVVVDPKAKVPPSPKETGIPFIVIGAPPGTTVKGLSVPSTEFGNVVGAESMEVSGNVGPAFDVAIWAGTTIWNPEELAVTNCPPTVITPAGMDPVEAEPVGIVMVLESKTRMPLGPRERGEPLIVTADPPGITVKVE
jgi:hypothetical protein